MNLNPTSYSLEENMHFYLIDSEIVANALDSREDPRAPSCIEGSQQNPT
ncbi:TPA_asm: hypothetical protein HUJ06_032034 [Nelumbo nucifera]|uniref:Uncharacterized protein n=1 Tax=Nelumbo nucifera TaxID=4432 RepID=A0A822Y2H3_NELNU|nr:TPA_asm: hypothetical protein HUJ06_026964 [Nelumbo nucifera]DAD25560.1 TPA_asm: hypothetical protein HUJ06_027024 [Nelumbo nucifera]DAD49313.1 TPA_asm: hypothetical protein HUJ06_032034 [Nelumbo nucifera]